MARQRAQARDDADLEREEGHELRQGHDAGGRPAGIEQGLQRGRTRIARMEHQQLRMHERGREARAQRFAVRIGDRIRGAGRVLDAQR
eukprot:gene33354-37688_t